MVRRDGGPAGPGAIEGAERALGVELPADYRRFLAEHDGVALHPNKSGADVLHASGELAAVRERMRDRMPDELLPIGETGTGDRIVLDARGRVHLWEHEFEADEGEPPGWDNVTELAPSFDAWFGALEPLTDDDLPDVVVHETSLNRGLFSRLRRRG
jgi:SMI1-KNR4 cell-wall